MTSVSVTETEVKVYEVHTEHRYSRYMIIRYATYYILYPISFYFLRPISDQIKIKFVLRSIS